MFRYPGGYLDGVAGANTTRTPLVNDEPNGTKRFAGFQVNSKRSAGLQLAHQPLSHCSPIVFRHHCTPAADGRQKTD